MRKGLISDIGTAVGKSGHTLNTTTMSKLRRLKPTRSRLTMATEGMAMTVAGTSTSSTRQFTVGITKAVLRWGTP